MKIFITGANGFIGSHLVPILIRKGHQVTCLVRDPSKARLLVSAGAVVVRGDVTDRETMRASMEGAQAVFHLAGWYALGNLDKAKMQAINVEGTHETLELAVELGVPKILFTSTIGVFGNTHGTIVDESYRVEQRSMGSHYERTKWSAHYEVAVPLQLNGAPVIILQPGGVTGPGDRSPHMAIFEFFLKRTPVMFGAHSGLTFAHVDDIAAGHVAALERGKPGEAYLLCGPALTYRQVFDICERLTGIRATHLWAPGWMAAGTSKLFSVFEHLGLKMPVSAESLATLVDYTFWATAEKARRELDWTFRPMDAVFGEVLDYERRERKK